MDIGKLFSLQDRVAIVTGGTGVFGSAMTRGLAAAGAKVGILGRRTELATALSTTIHESGGETLPRPADVLD